MSKRGASKAFISALTRAARAQKRNVFSVEEMKQVLASCRKTTDNFHDFLEKINHAGFLVKKDTGSYKLVNVDM